jgi:hypothetical protein
VVIRHQVKEGLEANHRYFMKERSILAGNVNPSQIERIASLYTRQKNMQARNIPVTHVIIRQLKEDTLLLINSQNMKARDIPVTHVNIKQLKEDP